MAGVSADGEAPGAALSAVELQLLLGAERAIVAGWELMNWWQHLDASGAYRERFDLATTHNRPDTGFGFFDEAEIAGAVVPVMGSVQEQVYDRPKIPPGSAAAGAESAAWMSRQVREFVLGYFLRVSGFARSQAYPGKNGQAPTPPYLQPFSWRPPADRGEVGFGFEQLYYKRKDEAQPARFAAEERHAIVDLREIGRVYEWVVLKAELFDFKLVFAPFGESNPHGTVPTAESSYLVLHEVFMTDEEPAGESDVGCFGLGFAVLPAAEESLLTHGLGRFDAAFQVIRFHVRAGGEVVARTAFAANRPLQGVQLDPVDLGLRLADRASFGTASAVIEPMQKMWSRLPVAGGIDVMKTFIDAANMVTRGGAARSLGVSKKQLHKNFLVAQFAQHHQVIAGSLATWRQIPDWLDRDGLPEWVISGKSPGS